MAKKSKGFGELLQQQKAEKIHQAAMDKLQQKVRQSELGSKFASMVANPKGEVKMSEVLEDFVEPYLDTAKNRSQRQALFEVAILAWNLAIVHEDERQQTLDQFIGQDLARKDRWLQQDVRETIDELITRKQTFFANNKRLIVDFQLEDRGNAFHLSVASTIVN